MTISPDAAKNRSYSVAKLLAAGDVAVFQHRGYCGQPLPAGTHMTVEKITNAGFRGIEVSGRLEDGTFVFGISAGLLTPGWAW